MKIGLQKVRDSYRVDEYTFLCVDPLHRLLGAPPNPPELEVRSYPFAGSKKVSIGWDDWGMKLADRFVRLGVANWIEHHFPDATSLYTKWV